MKRWVFLLVMAVAFILFSVSAEAKVIHFEIDGVPYAAIKQPNGTYNSFEVTAEYHAKFKRPSQKTFSAPPAKPKKATIATNLDGEKNIRNNAAPIAAAPAQKDNSANETHSKKLLSDWYVGEATYAIIDGQKKRIRFAVRSPNKAEEILSPDYKRAIQLAKLGRTVIFNERYDKHEYVKNTEKPVTPGTVVYQMLDPKPDWGPADVILDRGHEVQIRNITTGQFVWVTKPRALKLSYLTEYHKKIEEVRVIPTPEMYPAAK